MIVQSKRNFVQISLGIGLVLLLGLPSSTAPAQKSEHHLPLVIMGKMPIYPIMARLARVEGIVRIKVKTDGKKVASIDAESGPPMLVKFSEENIRTWEFADHEPTAFVTTFKYMIEGPDLCEYSNGTSVLNLPQEVRVSVRGLKTCDPAAAVKANPKTNRSL